jgi:hypothetical protein
MRFFSILAVLIALGTLIPGKAYALDWPWNWHVSWPWEWFDEDQSPAFGSFQPHLKDGKTPHDVVGWQQDDQWQPQDWIDARGGSAKAVMDGFYRAQVVTGQYTDGGVPVLEVGQGFMDLSSREQRRVATFVDYAFKVTENSPEGVFYIYHLADDDNPIGVYGKDGLQLQ